MPLVLIGSRLTMRYIKLAKNWKIRSFSIMFQAQYAMLIDIVHNAVLYTEPKKKVSESKLTWLNA